MDADHVVSNKDPAHPRSFGGRFHVLFRLGSGGMAAVYIARDPEGRLVAIKALHAHLEGERDLERDFLREAAISRRIQHPNVVTVGASGSDQGMPWLELEYVDGGTVQALHEAAGAEPLATPVVLRILVDLLRGLHAAHELRQPDGTPSNLVHRDVSPQNVLVGTAGLAKLTDFGVARIAERTAQTAAGLVKGKLRYMAPEQVVGKELDRRTDVFAAAVMAWELLANRRLYDGDDGNVIFQLVAGTVPTLASVRPDLDPALGEIVHRALAREPADRFATAEEFAQALEKQGPVGTHDDVAACVKQVLRAAIGEREAGLQAALAGKPVAAAAEADPRTTTRILVSPKAPRRARWLLVPAVLLLAGGAAAWLARPGAVPGPAPEPAPSAAAAAPPVVVSPSAAPEAAPHTVVVTSNAPLASVERVRGSEHAALAIPRGSVRLELPPARPGDVLRATAVDGRHAEATYAAGAGIDLVFSGPIPSRAPKPKGARDGLHRDFP